MTKSYSTKKNWGNKMKNLCIVHFNNTKLFFNNEINLNFKSTIHMNKILYISGIGCYNPTPE